MPSIVESPNDIYPFYSRHHFSYGKLGPLHRAALLLKRNNSNFAPKCSLTLIFVIYGTVFYSYRTVCNNADNSSDIYHGFWSSSFCIPILEFSPFSLISIVALHISRNMTYTPQKERSIFTLSVKMWHFGIWLNLDVTIIIDDWWIVYIPENSTKKLVIVTTTDVCKIDLLFFSDCKERTETRLFQCPSYRKIKLWLLLCSQRTVMLRDFAPNGEFEVCRLLPQTNMVCLFFARY